MNCPQSYSDGTPHEVNTIVTGATQTSVDGRSAALVASTTACGSRLLEESYATEGFRRKAPLPPNATDEEKKAHEFGENRPDLEKLMSDPTVRTAANQAWKETLNRGAEKGILGHA